jgi:hypothetical protein
MLNTTQQENRTMEEITVKLSNMQCIDILNALANLRHGLEDDEATGFSTPERAKLKLRAEEAGSTVLQAIQDARTAGQSPALSVEEAQQQAVHAVMSFFFNASLEEMSRVYGKEYGADPGSDGYLIDKFQMARQSITAFYAELDPVNQVRLVELSLARAADQKERRRKIA